MARKFLTAVDLTKNELQNAAIQNLGSAPSSPVKGQLYFNSTGGDNTLYWWDGTVWVPAKAPSTSGITKAEADGYYVNIDGDTMTGNLTLPSSGSLAWGASLATIVGTTSLLTRNIPGAGGQHRFQTNTSTRLTISDTDVAATVPVSLPSDPSSALHAATKQYVDNLIQGLAWKDTVRAATTTNGTLASAFANGSVIDGVTLATGNRILLKNQTTTTENGIYTVNASGAPTRATDADSEADLLNMSVWVSEGTTLADTAWVLTTNAPITVGSTGLTYVQSAGTGGSVSPSRLINTTAPLTGGGDLSADRTLAVSTFTSGAAGVVPASGGGTANFLRADGTWAAVAPANGSVTPAMLANADFGAFTVSSGVAALDAGTVTLAMMANLAQDQFIGRVTASTGVPETATITAAARTVLDDTTVAAMLTTLGGVPTTRTLTGTAPIQIDGTTSGDLSANRTISILAATTAVVGASRLATVAEALAGSLATVAVTPAGLQGRRFAQAVGGATSQVVTHNLNTQDVHVTLYRNSTPWDTVEADVERTTVNTITLRFTTAPAASEYRVLVLA